MAAPSLLLIACSAAIDESLTNLEVGDCIQSPGSVAEVVSVEVVPCDDEGTLQVIERFDIGDADEEFPGDPEVEARAQAGCPDTTLYRLFPTGESWDRADDRLVVCFSFPD